MIEHPLDGEKDRFDQEYYRTVFTNSAKALITDPASQVQPVPYEVASDRGFIASEFIRQIDPKGVADLAEGGRVLSSDLRYVTPTKLNEGDSQEYSAIMLTVDSYESNLTQRRVYALDLREDGELGLDWYDTEAVTEYMRDGKYVSRDDIEPLSSLKDLTSEEYDHEMARRITDRMHGHREMTSQELTAFIGVLERYVAARLSAE